MNIKFIIFIVCLGGLFAFQAKVILPFVHKVVASSLFLEDTGDEENRISTSNLLTDSAFDQCNSHIKVKFSPDYSITFPEKAINAFSLGNFQYVINADIEIQPNQGTPISRKYVCRIKYLEGGDKSGINDSDNWSVDGLSGLDDIQN